VGAAGAPALPLVISVVATLAAKMRDNLCFKPVALFKISLLFQIHDFALVRRHTHTSLQKHAYELCWGVQTCVMRRRAAAVSCPSRSPCWALRSTCSPACCR